MLTWPEAEIYCRDVEKGHLTSVGSLKESKKIEKHLRMLRNYFGFSRWWIGASDLYSEGHFSWTDGSPFKYERWIKGEPSGHQRGLKEDCAVVTTDPHWGRWRDEYCLNHLPFICEIKGKGPHASISRVPTKCFQKWEEQTKMLIKLQEKGRQGKFSFLDYYTML